jgi:hypothetical protein
MNHKRPLDDEAWLQQDDRIKPPQPRPQVVARVSAVTRLPADVFRYICTFLPPLQGPCMLAGVNREWCRLVKTIPNVCALHALYVIDASQTEAVIAAHTNRRLCILANETLADTCERAAEWLREYNNCPQDAIDRYVAFLRSAQILSVKQTDDRNGQALMRVCIRDTQYVQLRLTWSSDTETWFGDYYKQERFTLSTVSPDQILMSHDICSRGEQSSFQMKGWTTWLTQHGVLSSSKGSKRTRDLLQYSLLDDLFDAIAEHQPHVNCRSYVENRWGDPSDASDEEE